MMALIIPGEQEVVGYGVYWSCDVPASYVGQANKIVAVNAGETGLQFITSPAGTVTSVTGTANRITSTGEQTPQLIYLLLM